MTLPTLAGLPQGTVPPIPSAAPSGLDDAVGMPTGNAPVSFQSIANTTTGGVTTLLGLAGSLVSPVNQTAPANGTTSAAITDITPDSFVAKVAYLVLGIVVIAGAIYTYVK